MAEVQESVRPPLRQQAERPFLETETNWLKKLKDRFQRVWQKERKSEEPQIFIDIFYSPHGTSQDIEGLNKQFPKTDIFVPEVIWWTPEILSHFRNVSQGIERPEEALREMELSGGGDSMYSYRLGLLRLIYKSNKHITFIDVPKDVPLLQESQEPKFSETKLEGEFDSVLESFRSYLTEEAEFIKKREGYLIANFNPSIQALFDEYPKLRKKQKLRVLLLLGSFHTRVFHGLERLGQRVTREFSTKPYAYDFQDEALRRCMFGKEFDDELAAKALLERAFDLGFGESLTKLTNNTDKISAFSRTIISQFQFGEIQGIFNEVNRPRPSSLESSLLSSSFMAQLRIKARFKMEIENKLREKGIELPQSEVELDEMLTVKGKQN